MSMICFAQFVLLGTFAAILAAHRSDILEKHEEEDVQQQTVGTYEASYVAAE
jgi:hypothetical protein